MVELRHNMQEWGESAERSGVGDKKLISFLKQPRMEGFQNLVDLNLPRYDRHVEDASTFVEQFDTLIPTDTKQKWFVYLSPKDDSTGLMRYRRVELLRDEIIPFIQETTQHHALSLDAYDVVWNEDYEQVYGGNIIISKDGRVMCEFIKGNQGLVADGNVGKEDLMHVTRDEFFNSFKYSWEDGDGEHVRDMIYDVIMKIPHTGRGRHMVFTPGYYEFALVHDDDQKNLRPVFVDARV